MTNAGFLRLIFIVRHAMRSRGKREIQGARAALVQQAGWNFITWYIRILQIFAWWVICTCRLFLINFLIKLLFWGLLANAAWWIIIPEAPKRPVNTRDNDFLCFVWSWKKWQVWMNYFKILVADNFNFVNAGKYIITVYLLKRPIKNMFQN